MKQKFKKWWLVLIKGIILILLGFYVFRHPVDALVGLALYVGISLLITGIFLVIAGLSFRKKSDTWSWRLAEGIIDILFALVLLSNPAVTAAVFPFVVGFWIIVYGVIIIVDAVRYKKEGAGDWWMGLVGGIVAVIIGYFVTSNPIAGAITVTFWIGLAFLLLGIISVAASFSMKKINSVVNQ